MLEGNVAIVTGAAKGMGEVHARVMADRGAHVVLTDIDGDAGERVARSITKSGGTASFVVHDVRSAGDWQAAVEHTMKLHGRVDTLVNNAGVLTREALADLTEKDFDFMFAVNVKGTFLGCKAVSPRMRESGGGSIVNIGSMSGFVANMPGMVGYCATKGAIRMLTKALAVDLVDDNIRVNCVHPGTVRTPLSESYYEDPDLRKLILGTTLMKRPGEPKEISEAVVFLASKASSYMTGSDLVMDGGFIAV